MLTLKLKNPLSLPVDAAGWLPEACRSAGAAARFTLRLGAKPVAAGELFDISGDASDLCWRLEDDLSSVHQLGQSMSEGELTVAGDIGRHCAARMIGGTVTISGNAGDRLAAGMRGGRMVVHGNTGDHLGAAYPGEKFGMRGGEVIIHGAAGNHAGAGMRRGLLAVAGRCGCLAGYRMRAGTLLVLGDCGDSPGVEMLRGTLMLLGADRPALPPTFRPACRLAAPALGLLRNHLSWLAGPDFCESIPPEVQLYNGDLLRGGRGEVFTR